MTRPQKLREALREHALALPETHEDHPWGESVVKVRRKVFVFLGADESRQPTIGLKMGPSHPLALAQPGVRPMGYGLGDSGWIVVQLGSDTPLEMLREWVDESYRLVAPRTLVAQLMGAQRSGQHGVRSSRMA